MWLVYNYLHVSGLRQILQRKQMLVSKRKGQELTFAFFGVLMICVKAGLPGILASSEFAFEFLWYDLKRLWDSKKRTWRKHPVGFSGSFQCTCFLSKNNGKPQSALTARQVLWRQAAEYTVPPSGSRALNTTHGVQVITTRPFSSRGTSCVVKALLSEDRNQTRFSWKNWIDGCLQKRWVLSPQNSEIKGSYRSHRPVFPKTWFVHIK